MRIIVENAEAADKLNTLLHDYREYIIGRMGLPYRPRNISIISIAQDTPQGIVSTLSEKIGTLSGISVKIACSIATGE